MGLAERKSLENNGIPGEPIAKVLTQVKSRFWRQFSLHLLAYPSGYVLVGAARASKLALKIVTKIIDFPRVRTFAIGSGVRRYFAALQWINRVRQG